MRLVMVVVALVVTDDRSSWRAVRDPRSDHALGQTLDDLEFVLHQVAEVALQQYFSLA